MANTGFETFDSTINKTNDILGQIEDEFNWQDRRNQSYAILRSVMHALRDRMTVEKSISLCSQLTLLLKGVFIDGWDINKVPVKMDREQFVNRIRDDFQFSTEENMETVIDKVLNILIENIEESERDNIKSILPEDIASLV